MQADTLAALNEDDEVPLRLSAGGRLDKAAAGLLGVAFAYPGMERPLFTDVDMRVDGESRIVLLGELLRESDFGFWGGSENGLCIAKIRRGEIATGTAEHRIACAPVCFHGREGCLPGSQRRF